MSYDNAALRDLSSFSDDPSLFVGRVGTVEYWDERDLTRIVIDTARIYLGCYLQYRGTWGHLCWIVAVFRIESMEAISSTIFQNTMPQVNTFYPRFSCVIR